MAPLFSFAYLAECLTAHLLPRQHAHYLRCIPWGQPGHQPVAAASREPAMTSAKWTANVTSETPSLFAMMGRNGAQVIDGRDRYDIRARCRASRQLSIAGELRQIAGAGPVWPVKPRLITGREPRKKA